MLSRVLGSSRLALLLVVIIIIFSLAGAILPQEGIVDPHVITAWKKAHPATAHILASLSLFRIFHSPPFMTTILLLILNTVICTITHAYNLLKQPALSRNEKISFAGFVILHISIVAILTGGFISAGTRLSGQIILTEGQHFIEQHENYQRIAEGAIRPELHTGFSVLLKQVQAEYTDNKYLTDLTTHLEFSSPNNQASAAIKPNQPFSYQGLSFTSSGTGYSPRLQVRNRETDRVVINSYIALKTFGRGLKKEYRDFIPPSFLGKEVMITFYPDHKMIKGNPIKTGDKPQNPLLLLEIRNDSGEIIEETFLHAGKEAHLGEYAFTLIDLKRWAGFRVVDDPGYPIILPALWLGFASLLLRYAPDLRKWFKE